MPPERSQVRLIDEGKAVAFPGWLETPGLLHGTTTRAALPGRGKQDLFATVARLREAGVLPRRFTLGGDQVHGDRVETIHEPIEFGGHPPGFRWDEAAQVGEFAATDALVTDIPGVVLVVQTADCLPVLLMDRPTKLAGIAHCGWKGALAGLAAKTAKTMLALGAMPERLEAWIGPGIRAANYEVSRDRLQQFTERYPDAHVSPDGVHLDLAAVVRRQLEEAGLPPEHIFDSGECTRADPSRYYSYRAEGDGAGRLVSFIGFGPEDDAV
jgi:YfiH family protein